MHRKVKRMEQQIILIPAYNPNKTLLSFVENLVEHPFLQIIIVNDGSGEHTEPLFQTLSKIERVTILNHANNEGKGRAIKTGLTYIIKSFKKYEAVITAGADGQHSVEDLIRLSNSSRIFSGGIIIGIRNFKSELMPKHSFLKNRVTSILFDILFKKRLLDVQSGLRFFARKDVPWIRKVRGDQFDFDIHVLTEAIHRKIPIYEVPIGKAKMTKNIFLQYDEVYHPKILSKSYLEIFLRDK